jgi:acetyl-CoA C-acetyltransferase
VVGGGLIDFGEHFEMSTADMAEQAYLNAVNDVDAGIDPDEIEAAWYGTLDLAGDGSSGAAFSHATGLFDIPVTRVENACATGSSAVRNAADVIKSGRYDVVVALGVEKMRDDPGGLIEETISEDVWRGRGISTPALWGLRASRHMHEYETTDKHIAKISVKNHDHGSRYPHAHYKFQCNVDDVLNSPTITEPLTLYECCPVTDGAAAVVLASEDVATEYTDTPVWLAGGGVATENLVRPDNEALTGFRATRLAAAQAYEEAGITPDDIDVAEVHDCFAIAELLHYEDLGFCEKGKGGAYIDSGAPELGGEKPVNPSGGLLSKGHPIGATGVAQIVQQYEQLSGEAGPIQVDDVEYGLQHNLGTSADHRGAVCCINVLSTD